MNNQRSKQIELNNQKENYYILVDKIADNGIIQPKRHGYYIFLPMFDGYLLHLDTWSKAINVFKDGKDFDYLGIDFGGFKSNETMVKFWAAHI